ncbi:MULTISPECIES: BRO-N domain-containing protein [Corynebacterium]|uniref:BRO-N domain-containing protein n=1 Tax=Corynebacterium TaxID=1716 RepID=UPI0009E1979D|nr:Bro-N domain-containing protein [Corynebacterium amycolatum]
MAGCNFRVVLEDGEPWFVLKDVCDVLEMEAPHMVAKRLHEDDRNTNSVTDRLGRSQRVTTVNESSLDSCRPIGG